MYSVSKENQEYFVKKTGDKDTLQERIGADFAEGRITPAEYSEMAHQLPAAAARRAAQAEKKAQESEA